MIRYVFNEDEPLRIKNAKEADAQVIGEALAKISKAHEGRLKPQDVIAAARDAKSPLNSFFEWNDEKAADSYRLDQARSIIRIVRVVEEDDRPPSRAFVSIGDKDGTAYRAVGEVRSSVDLQARLLAQLDKELEAMQVRYRSLGAICEDVKELRERIKARGAKENRPAA